MPQTMFSGGTKSFRVTCNSNFPAAENGHVSCRFDGKNGYLYVSRNFDAAKTVKKLAANLLQRKNGHVSCNVASAFFFVSDFFRFSLAVNNNFAAKKSGHVSSNFAEAKHGHVSKQINAAKMAKLAANLLQRKTVE